MGAKLWVGVRACWLRYKSLVPPWTHSWFNFRWFFFKTMKPVGISKRWWWQVDCLQIFYEILDSYKVELDIQKSYVISFEAFSKLGEFRSDHDIQDHLFGDVLWNSVVIRLQLQSDWDCTDSCWNLHAGYPNCVHLWEGWEAADYTIACMCSKR